MRGHKSLALLASLGWVFSIGQAASNVVNVRRVDSSATAADQDSQLFNLQDIHTRAACNPSDRTYSLETSPAGKYMNWSRMNDNGVSGARQYVTIVNLTPHRFVLESAHSYQMDVFDWGDVPQGHARQNTVVYTGKVGANDVDDNGEAYYRIDGTDKKFVVRTTTHIPDNNPKRTVFDLSGMGLGQREYLDPATESPVTLVITGSNDYGFITNIKFGPGNWMKSLYDVIKDRQIQHVVMPGSHDAGMSTISNSIVSAGSSANTQTQGINIHDQLQAGSRWFDWRLGSVHDGSKYSFWTMHVSDELAEIAIGNTGESLDSVISEINQFTAANPGEIIFFRIRYLVGIRKIPSFGPIRWTQDIVNDFFGKLKGVNNRCGNLDTSTTFNQKPASYFMDQNGGKGCVLFLLAGDLPANVTQDSIPDGIYKANQLSINDDWSNLATTEAMAVDQAGDWKAIARGGSSDGFHVSQWLVSADIVTSTVLTLQSIAVRPTNPALYWMGVNNMSPESWPTVILADYVGTVVPGQNSWNQLSADVYTLAVGLNLYMISENCNVSNQRSPVLPGSQSALKALDAPWNGIIFANGTVLNDPPKHLHPGRVEVLKSGTMFLNGTVLTNDLMNPDFNSTMI
ncbi:hypothetical protein PT974_09851 [Cladobotryum mycophilum]|uniref:Uncharacterized protein n=1 Tax=Cladobotryum mycophilum TaxID=491253 RepID=A0ABR0SIP2_9HYPO